MYGLISGNKCSSFAQSAHLELEDASGMQKKYALIRDIQKDFFIMFCFLESYLRHCLTVWKSVLGRDL